MFVCLVGRLLFLFVSGGGAEGLKRGKVDVPVRYFRLYLYGLFHIVFSRTLVDVRRARLMRGTSIIFSN